MTVRITRQNNSDSSGDKQRKWKYILTILQRPDAMIL